MSSFSAAFVETCELCYARGARSIQAVPGCYEMQIDDRWWAALNPHKEPIRCSKDENGNGVPPFSVYIEFNGWPAGVITPNGGIIAAGSVANEDTYIEAVKAAIAALGGVDR